jgi:predicted secreted hydrolase
VIAVIPRVVALATTLAVLAGCAGGPILANPPAQRPAATPVPEATPSPTGPPPPMRLPGDDAPHDRLTEWWYYTGHLAAADGRSFGFEFVIFRAERGGFPVTWASHLALTDETGNLFHYAERSEIGPQVDRSGEAGFDLAITGGPAPPAGATPWAMAGSGGKDVLRAGALAGETSTHVPVGLDLSIEPQGPPMYHDHDGYVDFGVAGGSYYYSRPRSVAAGTVTIAGREVTVEGTAWFDHQWGDFIAVGGGGWDWFAVNLDDGTDLTLSLVRDLEGGYPLVYGTLGRGSGARHLSDTAFTVEVTRRWRSPRTGADYPAGWRIEIADEGLEIELTPTVADQELDTTASTGVVYWEGSQRVVAIRNGEQIGGQAYVELTGYGPSPNP